MRDLIEDLESAGESAELEWGPDCEACRTIHTTVKRLLSFYDAVKHGEPKHQDWLRRAIDAHFDGSPVPRE